MTHSLATVVSVLAEAVANVRHVCHVRNGALDDDDADDADDSDDADDPAAALNSAVSGSSSANDKLRRCPPMSTMSSNTMGNATTEHSNCIRSTRGSTSASINGVDDDAIGLMCPKYTPNPSVKITICATTAMTAWPYGNSTDTDGGGGCEKIIPSKCWSPHLL
jgi:hypothetical protein